MFSDQRFLITSQYVSVLSLVSVFVFNVTDESWWNFFLGKYSDTSEVIDKESDF